MDPNEKLTGITQMAPPSMMGGGMGGGQPPMPPMGGGQPPMPPMGGGAPMPEPGMGEMAMEGQPMEEAPMNVEQDGAALAQAVVGRTKGDIGAAVAVLDNAKAMLIASAEGGQEPQMMMDGGSIDYKMDGGPMYANMGRPLYREDGGSLKPIPEGNKGLSKLPQDVRNNMGFMNMGGPMYANMGKPLYREGGGGMGDSDVLREMIMENLQKPAIQEQAMNQAMGQMGMSNQMGMSKSDAMSDLMKYRMG